MSPPRQVLILTNEPALRNVCEQFFIVCGVKTTAATTVEAARAVVARLGLESFGLVILDTAALGGCEPCQQRVASELMQEWAAEYPGLPVLVMGTVLQKHTFLASPIDLVSFLVKPFRLTELVDAVQVLWLDHEFPPDLFVIGSDSVLS